MDEDDVVTPAPQLRPDPTERGLRILAEMLLEAAAVGARVPVPEGVRTYE